MKHMIWLTIVAMFIFAACGTTTDVPTATHESQGASSDTPMAQLVAEYDLHLNGLKHSGADTVPANLESPPWAEIQHVCREAGFDLGLYRGQEVTFKTYRLNEMLYGGSTALVVIERQGKVAAAYVVNEDESGGIYSLPDARANW